jgi:hypothetical protein
VQRSSERYRVAQQGATLLGWYLVVSWLSLKLARHPMDVLLAERKNDKENQETLTVINKSLNAGIGILASSPALPSYAN